MPTDYVLLPRLRYDSVREDSPYQVGERERWSIALHVSRISVGGSITVVIQKSPTGEEEDFETLVSFGSISATGTTTKTTFATPTADFTIKPKQDAYIRAVITAIVGEVIAEVVATAPFFIVTDNTHKALVSKELREWSDGFVRTMEASEEEVMNLLDRNKETGELDIDLEIPGAGAAVRREIAFQADHNRRREVLMQSSEASALVSLREMSRGVPGFGHRLKPYRPESSAGVWLGR